MRASNAWRLAALFHHRWAVPVLAELHRSSGGKFVTLVRHLGMSRDSLRRTLNALIESGWVMRNPGHGHPLRPEYILTPAGARIAPWSARLMRVLRTLGIEDVALRKWSMPVAFGLLGGRERFSGLRQLLPGATARALIIALKDLQAAGLVDRIVSNEYPPATYYQLTARGRKLRTLRAGF